MTNRVTAPPSRRLRACLALATALALFVLTGASAQAAGTATPSSPTGGTAFGTQPAPDLASAAKDYEDAVFIEDSLSYTEPPYWYYPVRQTLGAMLLLKGDNQRARDAFRESLAKTPNNAWSLYGLKTTFEKQGMAAEAREAERYLARAWSGDRKRLDLQRL